VARRWSDRSPIRTLEGGRAKVSGATYHDLVGLKHEVFNETTRDKVFVEVTKVLASA
jgi:hypothetical protein